MIYAIYYIYYVRFILIMKFLKRAGGTQDNFAKLFYENVLLLIPEFS